MNRSDLITVASAIMGKLLIDMGHVNLTVEFVETSDVGNAESGPIANPGFAAINLNVAWDVLYYYELETHLQDIYIRGHDMVAICPQSRPG